MIWKTRWGPYAICNKCNWYGLCAFGRFKLYELTYKGEYIEACPNCNAPKYDNIRITTARVIKEKKHWYSKTTERLEIMR